MSGCFDINERAEDPRKELRKAKQIIWELRRQSSKLRQRCTALERAEKRSRAEKCIFDKLSQLISTFPLDSLPEGEHDLCTPPDSDAEEDFEQGIEHDYWGDNRKHRPAKDQRRGMGKDQKKKSRNQAQPRLEISLNAKGPRQVQVHEDRNRTNSSTSNKGKLLQPNSPKLKGQFAKSSNNLQDRSNIDNRGGGMSPRGDTPKGGDKKTKQQQHQQQKQQQKQVNKPHNKQQQRPRKQSVDYKGQSESSGRSSPQGPHRDRGQMSARDRSGSPRGPPRGQTSPRGGSEKGKSKSRKHSCHSQQIEIKLGAEGPRLVRMGK
jgi:hypothetical protein